MAVTTAGPRLGDYCSTTLPNQGFSSFPNTSKRQACSNRVYGAWWLQAARLLESRYELTQRLSIDSYSAKDRLLGQRVIVRRLRSVNSLQGKRFFRALQSLASIRHPNFLNVIEVFCTGGVALFVTESPRGPSFAEIAEERSFDLDETIRLLPLAVLDFAAEHLVYKRNVSARSLYIEFAGKQEGGSDFKRLPIAAWPPFIVRLEVSSIARVQQRFHAPFSPAPREHAKIWAVRQTASLTAELLGIRRRSEDTVKSLGVTSYFLNDKSRSLLSNTARGRASFENAESLFLALESAATDSSVNGPKKEFNAPGQKVAADILRSPLLPLKSIGSAMGRVPAAFTRLIVLCALGAAMVWLFSPSKHKSSVSADTDRIPGAGTSLQISNAQAAEAVHDQSWAASGSDPATFMPDRSVIPSQAEQSVHLEDQSTKLAQPSHHRLPASGRARQHREKPALVRSGSRPIFWRQLVDFKVRLISLLRRSARPGSRHH